MNGKFCLGMCNTFESVTVGNSLLIRTFYFLVTTLATCPSMCCIDGSVIGRYILLLWQTLQFAILACIIKGTVSLSYNWFAFVGVSTAAVPFYLSLINIFIRSYVWICRDKIQGNMVIHIHGDQPSVSDAFHLHQNIIS